MMFPTVGTWDWEMGAGFESNRIAPNSCLCKTPTLQCLTDYNDDFRLREFPSCTEYICRLPGIALT